VNKHTKIAILIAPILAVLGYAATDMYSEYQASEKRVFVMEPQGDSCDIKADKCVLQAGEFLLSFSDKNGETVINSTYPLDTATLFLVDNEEAASFQLGMNTSPYYWRAKTNLGERINRSGSSQRLRIIANIKGGSYISEFTTKTL
jgi:hypothetical protein